MRARVTSHAELRLRKRLGLKMKSVQREANRVLKHGKPRTEYKGKFRDYLDRLHREGPQLGTFADVVVYGHNIYLVYNEHLITAWPVPGEFRQKKKMKFREIGEDEEEIAEAC